MGCEWHADENLCTGQAGADRCKQFHSEEKCNSHDECEFIDRAHICYPKGVTPPCNMMYERQLRLCCFLVFFLFFTIAFSEAH